MLSCNMTSVTISDDLRRKLKRLAAKYDTTQAEIIARALEIFEKYENRRIVDASSKDLKSDDVPAKNLDDTKKSKILTLLLEINTQFENDFPEIAERRKDLRQNIALLDEVLIKNWALPFEE